MATTITTRLPIRRDIEIRQGDSWRFPRIIVLPDLTVFGFTSPTLAGCEVQAQIRSSPRGEVLAEMEPGIISATERRFRPWLPAEDTQDSELEGYYDLQIVETATGWTRTFYAGEVILSREITR